MMLLLELTPFARGLVRGQVEVVNYPGGRFAVRHGVEALAFRVFDKIATVAPGTVVESKRLGEVLAQVQAQQAAYPANQRRGATGRAQPPNNLEAPGVPARKSKRQGAISTLRRQVGSTGTPVMASRRLHPGCV